MRARRKTVIIVDRQKLAQQPIRICFCEGLRGSGELVSVPTGISTKGASLTDRLLFAVPKKGRMSEKCLKFLEAAGLEYSRPDRTDVALVHNMPITLVFLPASDIASYVGEGNVDIGITGEDIVAESGVSVTTALKLGFGKCKLALQVRWPRELANLLCRLLACRE